MTTDGPIHRSPDEVAEYVAQHRIGAGGQILDPYSIAARIGKEAQQRVSPAESAGWQIIDSLDADTKAQLFALLEQDDETLSGRSQ